MGKKGNPEHLHKYKKFDIGTNGKKFLVYKCMKPICSHYVPISLSEGKLCECNRCGQPFIITRATLHHSGGKPMAVPHCVDCTKRKKNESVESITEFLTKIGS